MLKLSLILHMKIPGAIVAASDCRITGTEPLYVPVQKRSINENGKIVSEGTTDAVALKDGQVIFSLNSKEAHAFRITQFTASAKAEQPLPIYGNWELHFYE